MKPEDFYKELWKTQKTPLHRENNSKAYQAYANELMNILLYMGYESGKVLEIGCGNGALFKYFGFDEKAYTGIDFSSSLVSIFKENHPEVLLIEHDASKYVPSQKFDLIFGNAVHQHFSRDMLEKHLNNMLPALEENGLFVMFNLPYIHLRKSYFYGELWPNGKMSLARKTKRNFLQAIFSALGRFDKMGFWYSLEEIENMIQIPCTAEIFGSNFYPYRVHICIKRSS
ncbi:MAG: class I SAM-dependent methyltransferase [Bacteroidota bacterium]